MASITGSMAPQSLRRLHRAQLDAPVVIAELFERLKESGALLHSGMDHRNNPRSARVRAIGEGRVWLAGRNIEPTRFAQIYFSFELDSNAYFFAAEPLPGGDARNFAIRMPRTVYEAERRRVPRVAQGDPDAPTRVELAIEGRGEWVVDVLDSSYSGVALSLPQEEADTLDERVSVRFLDGRRVGETAVGLLRNRCDNQPGWVRLGLAVTQVPHHAKVPLERRERILNEPGAQRAWRRFALAGAAAGVAPSRIISRIGLRRYQPPVEVVEYRNEKHQEIRAIIDRAGEGRGGSVVVIPPAWGRTKETLLPLAATLIRTFERAGEPLTVVRFDGTQRRGESYIDPSCRRAGREAIHFTFSQAVRDIHATLRFVKEARSIKASRAVVISFSLSAIDGRRAVATDPTGIVCGWVSVVGMVDVQSGLTSVSGGVDYVYGAERGVHFGIHELGGVRVDIDRAAKDVLEHRLGGFEDARRDMAAIRVPVTWIHGRHDGWMDIGQVQELLSSGNTGRRRLIEVPTGHQLRSSREALETFQLVAEEVSELVLGRRLQPALPNLARLERKQFAERARRPAPEADLRGFWHDYLVGRDGSLGIELLAATSGYRTFMDRQIELLGLGANARVLDLGSGTGTFGARLAETSGHAGVRVTALDYVAAGLRRGGERLLKAAAPQVLDAGFVLANLDLAGRSGVPLRSGAFDAVLASLLVSYVEDPKALFAEVYRVLRPGGRTVVSAPKRDADLSKLYMDMMMELTPDRVKELFGLRAEAEFEAIQRRYLNEAARLVSLEEAGRFRFFDERELVELSREAGFVDVTTERALGDPPQTVVLAAARP